MWDGYAFTRDRDFFGVTDGQPLGFALAAPTPRTPLFDGRTLLVNGTAGNTFAASSDMLRRFTDEPGEVGLYRVNDAAGMVNGLLPSDAAYLEAALAAGHTTVLFAPTDGPGKSINFTLVVGQQYAIYLKRGTSVVFPLATANGGVDQFRVGPRNRAAFEDAAGNDDDKLAHDVNTTSSSAAAQETQFVVGVANWLIGRPTGKILVIESSPADRTYDFAADVRTALTTAGYQLTVTTENRKSLSDLAQYDVVVVGERYPAVSANENSTLTEYVRAGGNIYLYGGVGPDSNLEATIWEPFLSAFGLALDTTYNPLGGNVPIASSHPALAGITSLLAGVGSPVMDLEPENPANQVFASYAGYGLFAVYDGAGVASGSHGDHVPVFAMDLDAGVPAEFSGVTTVEPVQGFAGLGNSGNTFDGMFLRNATDVYANGAPSTPTTLTLTGLPAHTSIDLEFLWSLIDSWDGGIPHDNGAGPDLLTVAVDGSAVFDQPIGNEVGDMPGSYVPPSGVLLGNPPYQPRGFTSGSEYDEDAGFDMSLEPAFRNIPHTADTLTISW